MGKTDGATIIKKYANRRLYNTGTSTYVTLDDLATMVKEDEDFTVQDVTIVGVDLMQVERVLGRLTWGKVIGGGYPVGGLTVVRFRNPHLVYALTWFGMAALTLVGLWVFVRERRRRT